MRFLGALWDSGVWYIAVWDRSEGAVRGKFWGGIGVSGWGLLVFCCFNSVSRGSDDWAVGTTWGLNPRVTVSRGVMGVSDWGNKGSDIKGESYHCGGRCIVLRSQEFKNAGKYARIREWVCTNNHEILSLMLYSPFRTQW